MFNPRKFKIYVVNTKVWKGYDYVILPDGRLVKVTPGKYMRVTTNSFAFEDLTEELGQKPDYDYDEPACTFTVSGVVFKTVKLRCRYTAGYENHLYYGKVKVFEFKPGGYEREISFRYVDRAEGIIASALAGVAGGGATYLLRRNARLGLGVGATVTLVGSIASIISGE
jgi:hypothetical protein